MQNIDIVIPFLNRQNIEKSLIITFSLQETITNGSAAESDDQIKRRASQVYYTQDRMVTGEDYNVFPLNNGLVRKIHTVNRTYSGHNRFVDINDPTSKYQDTNVISDDGLFYKSIENSYIEIDNNTGITPEEIITNQIQPVIQDDEFYNFILETIRYSIDENPSLQISTPSLMWDQSSNSIFSSTGRFVSSSATLPVSLNIGSSFVGASIPYNSPSDMIQTGSLIKFKDAGWVGVELLVDNGDGFFASGEGKIRLAEPVKEGDLVLAVIPPIRLSFDSIEKEEIRTKILNSRTFGIYYDWQGDRWISIDPPIDGNFNFDYQNTYLKNDPKRN